MGMTSFASVWKWITKRSTSCAKSHIQKQNENVDWEDKISFFTSLLEIVNVVMQMRQAGYIQDGFDVSDFSRKMDRGGNQGSTLGSTGRTTVSLGGECQPALGIALDSDVCGSLLPLFSSITSLSQFHSMFLYSPSCLLPLHLCFQCNSSLHIFYHWNFNFHIIYQFPTVMYYMYYWHICL